MRISRWMPIAAVAVVIFIVLAVAVAVPLAWYGWHRWQLYDIAEQDACAERYLPIFQLTILEKLPSAKVRLDALAPVGGPFGITNDEKAKRLDALTAAEADYTEKGSREKDEFLAEIRKESDDFREQVQSVTQLWEDSRHRESLVVEERKRLAGQHAELALLRTENAQGAS
jgi:hypothetical protein